MRHEGFTRGLGPAQSLIVGELPVGVPVFLPAMACSRDSREVQRVCAAGAEAGPRMVPQARVSRPTLRSCRPHDAPRLATARRSAEQRPSWRKPPLLPTLTIEPVG